MPKESSLGYQRHIIPLRVSGAGLSGTGAVVLLETFNPGFRFWVEKLVWVTTDTLVGAGGSQTYVVRKGTSAGTALATVNPVIASQATIGTVLEADVSAANDSAARFGADTDTISVTRTTGGTAFTAGAAELWVVIRQRDQQRI